MNRRRAASLLALSTSLGVASVVAVACFPDFEVGSGAGGPPGSADGATLADGAPLYPTDGPPATLPDGAPLPDGGGGGVLPDGSSGSDGGPATFDAAAARLIPNSAGINFQFLDENQDPVSVLITHDFYMDTGEVTVARFKAWVAAAKPAPPAGTLDPGGPHETKMVWDPAWNANVAFEGYKDTAKCTDTLGTVGSKVTAPTYPGGDDTAPITCVNWFQAAAFCWWDGQKRLPTQVEWQYEATGRNRGLTYPWGDTPPPDCAHAIYRSDGGTPDYNGCFFPKAPGSAAAGASFDGVQDMAGSVFEFTWDWETYSYPATWPNDYAGPDAGTSRMARGGSFTSDEPDLHTERFKEFDDTSYYGDLGIRCVKTKL